MRFTLTGRYLALIIATILWGTSYPVVKIGLSILDPPIPPMGALFLRFSIALLVLIPFLPFITTLSEMKGLLTNRLIIYLGLINGGSYIFQFLGQVGTTAGIATLMVNTYLISTPIMTYLYLKVKISRRLLISVILGAIGVFISTISVLITDILPNEIFSFLVHTFIIFLSGIVWGGYAVVTNKLYQNLPPSNSTRSNHPITIFAVSNLISLVLIGLSMVILGQIPSVNQFSVNEWTVILYLALACTTTAFVLYIFASQSIAPTRINVILLLNLVIGLVLSALLLRDNLSFFMVVGSGLILFAIYLAGSEEHDSRIDLTTDTSL